MRFTCRLAPYTSMVAKKPSLLIIFDGIATHIQHHLFSYQAAISDILK
jgi:hypothetical protein